MANIFQTTFSNAFLLNKWFKFSLQFASEGPIENESAFV